MTENKDLIRFKNEPLTRGVMKGLIRERSFVSGLTEMINRVDKTSAEGGLTVYKKVGFSDLIVVKSYGLSDIRENLGLFGVQSDGGAHVSLHDPDESKRKSLGLNPNSYVRIGELHLHPANYGARFSEADFQDYERLAFGRNSSSVIICSTEVFEVVGSINYKQSKLVLFGYSSPKSGPVSNEYQRLGDNDTGQEQEESLARCGFRTVRLNIPIDLGKVKLQENDLTGLTGLGS